MSVISTLINGMRYDYSSIEININGFFYSAVQEINYSHSLEPGILRGTRPNKLGRTRGQYNAEASFTMYREDYQQFITLLQVNPTTGYMEKSFLITVIYEEVASGGLLLTDVLQGCRIKNEEQTHSQGSDALVVRATLDVMAIIPNLATPIAPTALVGF